MIKYMKILVIKIMRYAMIREMDISNGEGIGVSLFVQGCPFHCTGCFNPETWDFNGGTEWDSIIEDKFLKIINKDYIVRISLLGGEPLAIQNYETIKSIIEKIKNNYPDKKIWLYTGYKYENLSIEQLDAIKKVDILIDGQFDIEKKDLYNKKIIWAGSLNQRIIDFQQTLEKNKIILYKKGYKC